MYDHRHDLLNAKFSRDPSSAGQSQLHHVLSYAMQVMSRILSVRIAASMYTIHFYECPPNL